MRPERAKAFLLKQIPLSKTNSFTQGRCPGLNAFAPVGRGLRMTHIPRALPWASRCCPFRAFFPDVPLPTCSPSGRFPRRPATHVDDEDKGTLPIREGAYETRAIVINESGLYSLVLSSKLPQARP